MKKTILLTIAFIVTALSVSNVYAQVQVFSVTNNTGMAITSLSISPAGANTWSSNLFSKDKINNNENFEFKQTVQNGGSCSFDLKFVCEDGKEYIQNNVNLCSGNSLSLMMPKDMKSDNTDIKMDKTDTKTDKIDSKTDINDTKVKTDSKPDTKPDTKKDK